MCFTDTYTKLIESLSNQIFSYYSVTHNVYITGSKTRKNYQSSSWLLRSKKSFSVARQCILLIESAFIAPVKIWQDHQWKSGKYIFNLYACLKVFEVSHIFFVSTIIVVQCVSHICFAYMYYYMFLCFKFYHYFLIPFVTKL
jgi:hypothetical protein